MLKILKNDKVHFGQTSPTGTANFLSSIDGNAEGNVPINIEGVGIVTTDINGQYSGVFKAGTYNYSATDANGNTITGSFNVAKDMTVNVAVAFGNVISL
jgi:hypothetical protein